MQNCNVEMKNLLAFLAAGKNLPEQGGVPRDASYLFSGQVLCRKTAPDDLKVVVSVAFKNDGSTDVLMATVHMDYASDYGYCRPEMSRYKFRGDDAFKDLYTQVAPDADAFFNGAGYKLYADAQDQAKKQAALNARRAELQAALTYAQNAADDAQRNVSCLRSQLNCLG